MPRNTTTNTGDFSHSVELMRLPLNIGQLEGRDFTADERLFVLFRQRGAKKRGNEQEDQRQRAR